jgi:hypothetical protein
MTDLTGLPVSASLCPMASGSNSIPSVPGKQAHRPLRQLPGWQIVRRYKRAGWTQWLIADECGVSQGTVAKAIYRRQTGPATERVWAVLERILK